MRLVVVVVVVVVSVDVAGSGWCVLGRVGGSGVLVESERGERREERGERREERGERREGASLFLLKKANIPTQHITSRHHSIVRKCAHTLSSNTYAQNAGSTKTATTHTRNQKQHQKHPPLPPPPSITTTIK
jgi:hypothetical protein